MGFDEKRAMFRLLGMVAGACSMMLDVMSLMLNERGRDAFRQYAQAIRDEMVKTSGSEEDSDG